MAVCIQTPGPKDGVVILMHNVHTIPPFVSEWCGHFRYGQKVFFRGVVVLVFTAFPQDVPEGFIPVLFDEFDRYLALAPAAELEHV